MTKRCFRCEQILDVSQFYRHKKMADGYLGKCKDCAKADVNENRRNRIDYYREFDRQRANLAHRVEARKNYAASERGQEVISRARKVYVNTPHGRDVTRSARSRWQAANAEKRKAHVMVGNAIQSRRLIPQPCMQCGSLKVHAHHRDYSKPFDVEWLCPRHHKSTHKGLLP